MIWPERSSRCHVYANAAFAHTTFSLYLSARLIVGTFIVGFGVGAAGACSSMLPRSWSGTVLGVALTGGTGLIAGLIPVFLRAVWRWARGRGDPEVRRSDLLLRIEQDAGAVQYNDLIADHLVEHWLRLGRSPGLGRVPLVEWLRDLEAVERCFDIRLPRLFVVGSDLASDLRRDVGSPLRPARPIPFFSVGATRLKSQFWSAVSLVLIVGLTIGLVHSPGGNNATSSWDLMVVVISAMAIGMLWVLWRRMLVSGVLHDGGHRIEWRRMSSRRMNGSLPFDKALTVVMRVPNPLAVPIQGQVESVVRWAVVLPEPHEPIIIDDMHPGGTPWATMLRGDQP